MRDARGVRLVVRRPHVPHAGHCRHFRGNAGDTCLTAVSVEHIADVGRLAIFRGSRRRNRERRACQVLGADRTSVRYRGQRADDAIVRARLRELAAIRRRFGYRRLLVLMRREGLIMNHKKFRRLYREERLQVRRRGGL